MSKRHDVIGIKQVIRIEWMQKTTNLMLAGVDAKIRFTRFLANKKVWNAVRKRRNFTNAGC